jgi:hypothetical protein
MRNLGTARFFQNPGLGACRSSSGQFFFGMPLFAKTFFWHAVKSENLILMACLKKVFSYSGMPTKKIDPMSCVTVLKLRHPGLMACM